MGEHQSKMEVMIQNTFKMDVYAFSFVILMIFTVIEVAAVFLGEPHDMRGLMMVWAVLIGVGIVKAYFIAAWFMHLQTDPRTYFWTSMFPFIFVALMMWGIGLSNPNAVSALPAWCSPNYDFIGINP